jgi:hypothetical protein
MVPHRGHYRILRNQATPGELYSASLETKARDSVPGKTDSGVGRTEKTKNKPKKGKVIRLVLPGRRRHHRSVLGVELGTSVSANPGAWKRLQIMRPSTSQEGRVFSLLARRARGKENTPKANSSFTSLLQDNIFR